MNISEPVLEIFTFWGTVLVRGHDTKAYSLDQGRTEALSFWAEG